MRLLKDGLYHHVASYGHLPEYKERVEREPLKPGRAFIASRVALEGKSVHVIDALLDPSPEVVNRARTGNVRTALGVPLLRQGTPIGVLLLQRSIVQAFTDKEIALAETFADQAVIAIENVRLFEAEQLRTRELTESLEQQTATSEVLRVISSSQGELQPVFDTMLANATRVCEAQFGHLLIPEGDAFRNMAICDAPSALAEKIRGQLFRPHPDSSLAQAGMTKQPLQVHDLLASRPYLAGNPAIVMLANLGAARTLAAVPMLNESELVGVIILYRNAVHPFTDKQIELVQNFAAQAVIAIENARLLSELRQRTDALTERTAELTELLEQQTATSEVLQVISASPGDLQPVFETMLQNAVRICDAKFGGIYRIEDNTIRLVATHADVPAAYAGARRFAPFRPSPKHYFGRMMAARTVVHIADAAAEQGYVERRSEYVAAIELGGVRTFMAVPMLKENEPIGAFLLARQEVRPFTDKQIALVTNFAAQAVIAIENARLLNELRESLQQQTATADVLRVISNSPTNIQPVLDAIVQTAGELCASEYAIFFRLQDGKYHVAASNNTAAEYVKYLTEHPISIDRGSLVGRTALERRSVHIPDCLADPEYTWHEYARVGKHRSMLGVPLLRDGAPIGVIGLLRTSVRPYTEKQIELVTTFADQAVIAIENTRLFEAEKQRTRELSESLEQQTATSEVLQVISSSPGDLEPVFSTMLAKAVSICDAKFGNIYRWEDDALRLVATHNSPPAFAEDRKRNSPYRPGPTGPFGRLIATKSVIHVDDLAADEAYVEQTSPGPIAGSGTRRNTDDSSSPDAEGERTDRCVHPEPPRSSSLHRQADRACHELRQPSRHCHRECAAIDRTAPAHRGVGAAAG